MTNDPILFNNGMQLVFRRCEATAGCGTMNSCPNQYCPPETAATVNKLSAEEQVGFQSYAYDPHQHQQNLATRAAHYGLVDSSNNAAAAAAFGVASAAANSTAATTNYSEYYLGKAGQTCTQTCAAANNLKCNFNMVPVWDPTAMMKHLNVSNCWRNGTAGGHANTGMKWYAPDQPGYIPGKNNPATGAPEPNYNECMGFVGFPAVSKCDASFPSTARVCRCTVVDPGPAPAPPAPPPGPEVVYTTLVWAYVWDTGDAVAAATADSQHSEAAVAMHVVATLADAGLVTELQEDAIVDKILKQDAAVISLLAGFSSAEQQPRLVRHLARHMGW